MARKIVILEDNEDRQAAMRACIADRFYSFDAHFFDTAPEAISFLEANLAETLVISLDNDLEPKPGPNGRAVDPDEGRQVAEFLATHSPVCPVVINTSNSNAAVAMQESLREAGWKTRRVVPLGDLDWIADDWFFAMRRALVGPVRRRIPDREKP